MLKGVYMPQNACREQATPVHDVPPLSRFSSSRAISSALLPTHFLLFSSSLAHVLLLASPQMRLRQQHRSFDLWINLSHLDINNFFLNPLGTRLCQMLTHRGPSKALGDNQEVSILINKSLVSVSFIWFEHAFSCFGLATCFILCLQCFDMTWCDSRLMSFNGIWSHSNFLNVLEIAKNKMILTHIKLYWLDQMFEGI
jgi:hypothetical protein